MKAYPRQDKITEALEDLGFKQVVAFINEEISLQPNSSVTIWDTPDGLKYTCGSMEYREQEYKVILLFRTMDDVPEGEELENSVKFQMNK